MDTSYKKLVSIIIVTYFSEHEIRACLDAVLSPIDARLEIIVIDNVSKDATIDILKNEYANNSRVRLVFNSENTGFARGNNQGAELAEGKYLLILNPDTVASGASIIEMVEYFETHPEVGVLGPKIVDEYGVAQESYGEDLTPWNEFVGKIFYSKYAEKLPFVRHWKNKRLAKGVVRNVGWIGGACALIRKDLFLKIGGIDTTYFLSYADMIDLGKKIKLEGLKAVLYPKVQIVHAGSKSVVQDRTESLRASYIGTLHLFEKYYGEPTVFFAKTIYVTSSLLKAIIAFPISLIKKDPYRAIAIAHATNAGRIVTGTLGTIK